ncbi:MAG TPA: Gfo/Idh/MocA family oxidoreductase, partial [Bacteroidales bacterium]|nr:Gfo/Idh/MocA family oxidoreductase [Bacteroidales bacterium]
MLKMGVLGAGHLGKIHIQCIREIGQYELLGFYDPDESIAQQVAEEFSIPSFSSLDDLIRLSDV